MSSAERRARGGELELCCQAFGPGTPPPPLLVMVMGLASQMVLWDDEFCRALANRGLRAIRSGNRDTGRSTILRGCPVPAPGQLLSRDRRAASYSLDDMADDAAGLLDHLETSPRASWRRSSQLRIARRCCAA